MTKAEVEQALERAEKATPGPGLRLADKDWFDFLATARTDVPALCRDWLEQDDVLLRFNRAFSKWACGSEFHDEPERMAERIEQAMEFRAGIAAAKAVLEQAAEIERLKADAFTVAHLRSVRNRVSAGKGAGADLSDAEVAGRVRMLFRHDSDHEAVCLMGRDRIIALSDEIERLKATLAEAPHADDCASLNRFIHTEPCPYWTKHYCLMEKCIHGVMMCEPCEKCAKYEPSTVLTFPEGAERCHRAPCDCWKSKASSASDRQPTAEAPHSYLCAASTEGNPIKIGTCDCRKSASDSQPVTGNPFPPIQCVCGETWTQEMHTVCPRCASWPRTGEKSNG